MNQEDWERRGRLLGYRFQRVVASLRWLIRGFRTGARL